MGLSKAIGIFIRILVSVAAIAGVFLLLDIDGSEIWRLFAQLDVAWFTWAIALMCFQLLLTAVRWHQINKALDIPLSLRTCAKLMCIGQFFNQCLPTSIGGDGVKVGMLCHTEKLPFQTSLLSVLLDRLVGMVVLVLVACSAWLAFVVLWLEPVPQQNTISVILTAASVGLAFVILVVLPRIESLFDGRSSFQKLRKVAALCCELALRARVSVNLFLLSALVQFSIVFSIFAGSRALNIELPGVALLLLPLIIFVASLPFSFAGWGLREGAMVTGLAIVGVAPSEALSISILHGITQLIIGLPGAYITATQVGFGVIKHFASSEDHHIRNQRP